MITNDHQPPEFATLARKLARTGLGALGNRAELFAVEWQEEKARLLEVLVWAIGLLFLGIVGILLLTAIIIFLFPEDERIYVAAAFAFLYLAGAVAAGLTIRSRLKHAPFAESIEQLRKDRLCFESLE